MGPNVPKSLHSERHLIFLLQAIIHIAPTLLISAPVQSIYLRDELLILEIYLVYFLKKTRPANIDVKSVGHGWLQSVSAFIQYVNFGSEINFDYCSLFTENIFR